MPRIARSLRDASNACAEIGQFIHGTELNSYRETRSLQLIIERLLLIVGEALIRVRRVDSGVLELIPDAHNVIAMRHVIVHGYDAIDNLFVWTAASKHVPLLKRRIDAVLRNLDD